MIQENIQQFDIVILGAGPGGVHAAGLLAAAGKSAAIVEGKAVGGRCLHTGCIPTKLLAEECRKGDFNWKCFKEKFADILESSEDGMRLTLASRGVKVFMGYGEVDRKKTENRNDGKKCVKIIPAGSGDDEPGAEGENDSKVLKGDNHFEILADTVICAIGASSYTPGPLSGCSFMKTTDNVWDIDMLPERMVILGGGAAGTEIACALAGVIKELHLIEAQDQILGNVSENARVLICEKLEDKGVQIHTSAKVSGFSDSEGVHALILEDGSKIETDLLLVAAGCRAENHFTGDSNAVTENEGSEKKNFFGNISSPGTYGYVIGDAAGGVMTAVKAKADAEKIAECILTAREKSWQETIETEAMNGSDLYPECIFTTPEIAGAGLGLEEALKEGYDAVEGIAPLYALGAAKIHGSTEGYMSIVRDRNSDLILGAEFVCENACELIHIIMPYMLGSIPAAQMKKMHFAHPVMAEGIRIALDQTYGGSVELPVKRRRR